MRNRIRESGFEQATEAVSSNGWVMPATERYLKPIRGIEDPLQQPDSVRHTLEQNGFALLFGLLPERRVNAALRAYEAFEEQVTEARSFEYGREGHPAHTFVRSASFAELCEAPELTELGDVVLGGHSRLLRRRPFRHFIAGTGRASRAHRDWSYIDRGTQNMITVWLPLLPCGLFTGTLIYLEASRHLDITELRRRMRGRTDRPDAHQIITNDIRGLADITGNAWRYPEMRLGDVLVHDPYIVHASLDCKEGSRRISTDLRLIRVGETADPRWDSDWAADDGF